MTTKSYVVTIETTAPDDLDSAIRVAVSGLSMAIDEDTGLHRLIITVTDIDGNRVTEHDYNPA